MTPKEILHINNSKINQDGSEFKLSIRAMEEFGKQCFEVAKYKTHTSKYIGGELHNYWNITYNLFEDYLKELYEGKDTK